MVLVGEDPASATYVSMKKSMAGKVGFNSVERVLPANVSQQYVTPHSVRLADSVDSLIH